ncbi:hypothetical protein EVG20_g5954 [Dentipellis fragilis]|uniref:Uncharacterized protein n=1 Tax=Dentipellis fragilis TaxID=205917 RepID=A0A4Y9YRL4_9AGAM|nr:hypothetical protein EVG20_g5954 [Dentipellis fragilis]
MPATQAYGFVLDMEIIRHWAIKFYTNSHGDKLSTLSPEDAEEELSTACTVTISMLPMVIYREFPRIPSVWYRLARIDRKKYLLVLKDNETAASTKAKVEPDDVEGVRQKLDLGTQRPRWYPILT